MFEDFSTIESRLAPHIVNAVCDLPSLSHADMWFPCCNGQLFRMIEWTAVYLDRLENGQPVEQSSLIGHPVSGRG